ncbi:receptor-type tyrosine-protein phosphatase S-like [Stylophora pistillata]|uniref:receptor-type tyrosine-protein phosphatase S-like n=1 Tax=Stylophora pistillata TaxID=50429 RepID=UPI000C0562DA|nr:receptor-type tyrosine-protein phosphatase S-like [Stylophora pistillata]
MKVNVALGMATLQSSTFNNTNLGVSGVSEKAVDGNSNTEFRNGSCTLTRQDNPSWWRVDLGSDKVAVSDISIVNRFSTLTDVLARNKNYKITLACQMQAIGAASPDTLPDASFSASSEDSSFQAFKGRLNANRAWRPRTNDIPGDYLQIDLQYEFLICAVATQGMSTSDDWTTEYKLQLSSDGSTFVTFKKNNVDKVGRVPSQAPSNLTLSASSSTSITASWQLPPVYSRHGIIVGYKLFYKKKGFMGSMSVVTINDGTTFSGVITGLDKYTEYEFQVLAFTSHGDGPKSSVVVERTMEDEPRGGPADVVSAEVNKTTFNISWAPLSREQTNGDIILYNVKEELMSRGTSQKRSLSSKTVNTTNTFILLNGLLLCSQYQVSVRAYTKVKYLGTKPYNESFREEGFQDVGSSTSYTMKGLVPGSIYEFQIIVSSVCGLGVPKGFPDRVETEMTAPMAPFLIQWTNVEVFELSVEIDLWPVEQRNGPISAYQVIVRKVCDCYQEPPRDFDLKLKDLKRNNDTFYPFYVAAEIKNNPVHDKSWKFTVGDGKSYGAFVNKELTRGESYIVYQRALTIHNSQILEGEVSKIAMISVKPGKRFNCHLILKSLSFKKRK